MQTASKPIRNRRGKFQPGTKPGPGRPKGVPSRLSAREVKARFLHSWETYGEQAIKNVIAKDPAAYLELIVRLMPAEDETDVKPPMQLTQNNLFLNAPPERQADVKALQELLEVKA